MNVSAEDAAFVRELVRARSSIALGEDKRYLIEARLGPLARREGFGTLTELIGDLRDGRPDLHDDVVGALTTNETWFFREHQHFDALRDHVLPELAAAGRRLSLWSAAGATGQEAYSLAMLLLEDLPHVRASRVLCSDVSTRAVARAAVGRYSDLEVGRGLPVARRDRHFVRHERGWVVDERLRAAVACLVHNLTDPVTTLPPMDVVLLRNVMIYFDAATRTRVLDRMVEALRPGGYLFVGSSEASMVDDDRFERVRHGTATYHRLVAGGRR